jgi:predicted chitinase
VTDAPPPSISTERASVVATAGKWLSLFGVLIATGQAGTTWLHGYWQAESEKQKSAQELALAELKDKSELAQQYLKVILDKDTKPADRALLLTALGDIEGHPLQKWAQEQYQQYKSNLDRVLLASKEESDAEQQGDSAANEVTITEKGIADLNAKIELVKDDPVQREKLQDERSQRSKELAHLRASLTIATVTVKERRDKLQLAAQGLPIPASANAAGEITSISSKITVSLLESVFPAEARRNIELNAPYLQAALEEFGISNKQLAAAIVAAVAVESPDFASREEAGNGMNYEGRGSLGNTSPGDGPRFKGRGYLQLVGRTNYTQMSQRLGLGSRLVDSPEDANSPEVASRILVAYFVDRPQISAALANGDLAGAWRRVEGGPHGFEQFAKTYNQVLAQL